MKLTNKLTATTLLSAALGLALSPTIVGASDPPAEQESQAEEAHQQAVAEAAFLGINTAPLGTEARRTLDLAPGTALIIRSIGPGTPAKEAGLLSGDVLVRLNDQLLINSQQLAVLVRTFAPGDEVSLHVLRNGEPIELKATLAGRVIQPSRTIKRIPMPPIGPLPNPGDLDAMLEQLRGPGVDPFAPGADLRAMMDQMQRRMFEQRDEMLRMMDQMRNRLGAQGMQSAVSINDGQHILQLKANGQDRHLTVKTRDGELLFEGPLPENGQIESLPADVQKKVDDLLKNNRIEFQMPQPPPPNREPLPVA